jgi:hypothetical protein
MRVALVLLMTAFGAVLSAAAHAQQQSPSQPKPPLLSQNTDRASELLLRALQPRPGATDTQRITCQRLGGNFYECASVRGGLGTLAKPDGGPQQPAPSAPQQQPQTPPSSSGGISTKNLVSSSGIGAAAFKGYQFSNVGTLGELQQKMRALGMSEKIVKNEGPKLLRLIQSKGGRYGLLLTAVAGGTYALYEITKPAPDKK